VSSQERAFRPAQLRRPPKALPAAPPGDQTRPDQVNDRPPLTMHEVVRPCR
jgi:hypothetical protein